ncbi:MAG TPA: helix-turn-helix domain-containing protein [bacterium]|nr:helix-turn-helix domain-containing protein [bacterium]
MAQHRYRQCSVERTLAVMGDPWGFLILRAAFFGLRKHGEIRQQGAIPGKILAARLKALVAAGVLTRRQYQEHPPRFTYRLTEQGHDLYLPAVALMHWGDRWMAGSQGAPVRLTHASCGRSFHALVACPHCRQELDIQAVTYRDGPGAGLGRRPAGRRNRRSPAPAIYQRGRPCSVARALGVVADRWVFLIMREACFGARRFEEFRSRTGIARNILADRLQRLVAAGLLRKAQYLQRPARFEYRLAEKGRSLYQAILALLAWGDRWLAGPKGPPLLLTHSACGRDFEPQVLCSACGGSISSRQVRYREMFRSRGGAARGSAGGGGPRQPIRQRAGAT